MTARSDQAGVRLYAFNTGWFQCRPGYFVEGDEGDYLRGPVPSYLIEHPQGRVLFDTGMGVRYRRELADALPAPMTVLYTQLQASEARHFELYLQAADAHAEVAGGLDARARLAELAAVEAELVSEPDSQFRFHSGPPRDAGRSHRG